MSLKVQTKTCALYPAPELAPGWQPPSFLDYGFPRVVLYEKGCPSVRLSEPGALVIQWKCFYGGLRRTFPRRTDIHRHPHRSLLTPPFALVPFLRPTITKLSSSSMKHLFLFLFDMGDSIKASGSKCCNTRLSVETSKNVTLPSERKNSLHPPPHPPLSLFFPPEALNKQDLYPWPRNASKSTCLLGLAVKCRAVLAA